LLDTEEKVLCVTLSVTVSVQQTDDVYVCSSDEATQTNKDYCALLSLLSPEDGNRVRTRKIPGPAASRGYSPSNFITSHVDKKVKLSL
jgi:hypothetical protein